MKTLSCFALLGLAVLGLLSGNANDEGGSAFGILTASVTPEPDVAGQTKRLRLRQLSRVANGVRDTEEDGVVIVINDQST